MRLITECDHAAVTLRERLDVLHMNVYANPEFLPTRQNYFWRLILPHVHAIVKKRGRCRLLEIGAGISGLSRFLREHRIRDHVVLTLHDIIPENQVWLGSQAEEVVIGPVACITGEFDLIVSSFVLEHMTDPRASLEAQWERLACGGTLILICPHYGPFYLPPACNHVGAPARFALRIRLLGHRIRVMLKRRPAFLLLSDPAAFHLPFSRDRDAVHLVSWTDLRCFFKQKKALVKRVTIRWGHSLLSSRGLKEWVISHWGLIAFSATKVSATSLMQRLDSER